VFGQDLASGYDTLLLDVVQGDQMLFVHADETEAAWRLYTPLIGKVRPVHSYAAGGAGPAELTRLTKAAAHGGSGR